MTKGVKMIGTATEIKAWIDSITNGDEIIAVDVWMSGDVQTQSAEVLTDNECIEVLHNIGADIDPVKGLTWSVVDSAIEELQK